VHQHCSKIVTSATPITISPVCRAFWSIAATNLARVLQSSTSYLPFFHHCHRSVIAIILGLKNLCCVHLSCSIIYNRIQLYKYLHKNHGAWSSAQKSMSRFTLGRISFSPLKQLNLFHQKYIEKEEMSTQEEMSTPIPRWWWSVYRL
jgi:hypothetical protein